MTRSTQPEISLPEDTPAETRTRVSFFIDTLRRNPGAMVEVLCGTERPDIIIKQADNIRPDGTPKGDALAAAAAIAANRDYHYLDYDRTTYRAVHEFVQNSNGLDRDQLALGRLCVLAREEAAFQEFTGWRPPVEPDPIVQSQTAPGAVLPQAA